MLAVYQQHNSTQELLKYGASRQFLLTCPGERGRLWEVQPPGAWGQRVNIWLKVYLQEWRLQDGEWDRHLFRGLVTVAFIAAPDGDSFTPIGWV